MEFKHIPIMLNECIDGLDIKPNGVYVDATLGGAGHSSEIVKHLSAEGVLIAIDKDIEAINVSKLRLKDAKCKIYFVQDDFKNYKNIILNLGFDKVDGILIDLGVSSYQIDNVERGFSYKYDAPLDMRMDRSQSLTAKEIVNTFSYQDLVKILFDYGEEDFAKSIAKKIVALREVILHKGGSVAKKTFQALRIQVNGELDGLEQVLGQMIDSLNSCGRICVLTFHSLEDRIVKNVFRLYSTDCICPKTLPICVCHHKASIKLVNKKPIVASKEEQSKNSRSNSCKLRIASKI